MHLVDSGQVRCHLEQAVPLHLPLWAESDRDRLPEDGAILDERMVLAALSTGIDVGVGKDLRQQIPIEDTAQPPSWRPGEVHALLGANGAGKSTLLKLATGHLRPDLGQVRVRGLDTWLPAAKRHVGYCPDADAFYEGLSGRQFIEANARLVTNLDV